jgi:Ca2+-transporting ATPase
MQGNPFNIDGLTDEQVTASRAQHGRNVLEADDKGFFWPALKAALTEPMFLLLLATSIIYFVLGERTEGLLHGGRHRAGLGHLHLPGFAQPETALARLRAFSEAQATVIRNNAVVKIPVEDVVVGDHAVAEEGSLLAADGVIVQSNDFSVNESILTGEAFAVARSAEDPELANVSKGTQVVSGLAVYRVTAVGKGTQLGTHQHLAGGDRVPPTPLQQQITRFVRNMAIVGVVFFAWCGRWISSRSGSCWTVCSPASRWPCPSCRKRSPWPSPPSWRWARGDWPSRA